jgi:uncharacterized membrane protein YdbT with pleckstrin-like domain
LLHVGAHLLSAVVGAALVAGYFLAQSMVLPFPPVLILGLLVIPAALALWYWIRTRTVVYEITTERVKTTVGLFSKRTDELELYRVRDITLFQPFKYRLFGLGNIVLNTTDATSPVVTVECIPGAGEVRERLRDATEICRDRKRARITELSGGADLDVDGPGR